MQPLLTNVQRIVFLGDSLTDGAAWPDWVVETLVSHGLPRPRLHNAGVAGNTAAQMRARYETDVIALRPDLVVMHCGTNDANRGVSVADYARDMEAIVLGVRATGARMLLLIPPAMRDPERDARLRDYFPVLTDLATRYNCAIADIYTAFMEAAAQGVELWGPDGIHHRIDGWRTMARGVLAALGCVAPLVERTHLEPGALIRWEVSAPVPWHEGDPYPHPPLEGWNPYDGSPSVREDSWWQVCWLDRGGVMPLGMPTAGAGVGAFARTAINVEAAQETTLHVGGSPPLALWLNDEMVWDTRIPHGYHPDADRFPLRLHAGENRLQVFSTWLFHVSID